MRVLAFCEYASLNGGERSFLEAVRHFDSNDLELIVAGPSAGPLADALAGHGLQHVSFDVTAPDGRRLSQAQLRQQIASLQAMISPDLLHANSLSMSRLIGPVARDSAVASIGHLRDIMRLSRQAVIDLNRHACLLAVSHATKAWYVDLGVDAARVHVMHNGVDLQRFSSRPSCGTLRNELHIPLECPIVGSIGQLGMRKGVDQLVDAALQLAPQWPDVHFVYVGQRYSQKAEAIEYETEVRRQAERPALNGRFHFLGRREQVERLLSDFTIYAHAARQEPLGRVLLEAGAAALPIVTTDVGGSREIFPQCSSSALLVPSDSPAVLATAINSLLASRSLRQQLARHARRRIKACFGGRRSSKKLGYWYRRTFESHDRT